MQQALAVRPGFTPPPRVLSLLLVTTLISFAPGCMNQQVKPVSPGSSAQISAPDALKKVFGTSNLDDYRRKIPRLDPTGDVQKLLSAKSEVDFRNLTRTMTSQQILKIAKEYRGSPISRRAWIAFWLAGQENPKNRDYKFDEVLAPDTTLLDLDAARSLVLMILDESSRDPHDEISKLEPGLAFCFVTVPKGLQVPVLLILLSNEGKLDARGEDIYSSVIDGTNRSYEPELTAISRDPDPMHKTLAKRAAAHLERIYLQNSPSTTKLSKPAWN